MIRHNILFKVKSHISEDEIRRVIELMCAHERNLPGVFSMIGGECQFHDDKSTNFFMHDIARGASHCISIDFVDRKSLDDFFEDSALLDAKKEIVRITEGGYDGIVAFDLENPDI